MDPESLDELIITYLDIETRRRNVSSDVSGSITTEDANHPATTKSRGTSLDAITYQKHRTMEDTLGFESDYTVFVEQAITASSPELFLAGCLAEAVTNPNPKKWAELSLKLSAAKKIYSSDRDFCRAADNLYGQVALKLERHRVRLVERTQSTVAGLQIRSKSRFNGNITEYYRTVDISSLLEEVKEAALLFPKERITWRCRYLQLSMYYEMCNARTRNAAKIREGHVGNAVIGCYITDDSFPNIASIQRSDPQVKVCVSQFNSFLDSLEIHEQMGYPISPNFLDGIIKTGINIAAEMQDDGLRKRVEQMIDRYHRPNASELKQSIKKDFESVISDDKKFTSLNKLTRIIDRANIGGFGNIVSADATPRNSIKKVANAFRNYANTYLGGKKSEKERLDAEGLALDEWVNLIQALSGDSNKAWELLEPSSTYRELVFALALEIEKLFPSHPLAKYGSDLLRNRVINIETATLFASGCDTHSKYELEIDDVDRHVYGDAKGNIFTYSDHFKKHCDFSLLRRNCLERLRSLPHASQLGIKNFSNFVMYVTDIALGVLIAADDIEKAQEVLRDYKSYMDPERSSFFEERIRLLLRKRQLIAQLEREYASA